MISAVILTKNEAENIEACIKTLKWCDEIIVIDDNSTDKTVSIAEKLGAKVFIHSLENNFSQQRNFGLSETKGEWVLFIDADERISDSLAFEIVTTLKNSTEKKYDGFFLHRIDIIWGKKLLHGETGNIKLLRLVHRNSGKWEGSVHEIWKTKGRTALLKNLLYHYPHQTVGAFLQEINFYTDIRAEELYKNGVKVYWWSVIIYPKTKFFINYILKMGFFDGIAGLVFALMMSFHSFLVRGKLWLLWNKKEK